MRRFFYAVNYEDDDHNKLSDLSMGQSLVLTESITHHWCKVLRASVGEKGVVFDGFGGEYEVELSAISKKQATATLLSHRPTDRTADIISKVALVMSRGDRMDYAIQKATELGVTAVQLLSSHHGEVTLKPAQVDKKLAHWQQIAIAACEQCGLNRPPLILAPMTINDWLTQSLGTHSSLETSVRTMVSPTVSALSQDPYYHILNRPADISLQLSVPAAGQPTTPTTLSNVLVQERAYIELLIGPEGGLSPNEISQASDAGFYSWQIGCRILRTETAPVVALATLQAMRQSLIDL
nr:16S rRNA (uracil(1498)-N(3))-methyltransferase [uncultured Psychrobacter sp.]